MGKVSSWTCLQCIKVHLWSQWCTVFSDIWTRILSGVQYFQIYGQEPGPLPSSEPLYKKLEILKFDDIFKFSIANFVFSTLTYEKPAIFDEWFRYDHQVHEHATKASKDVIRENHFDVG